MATLYEFGNEIVKIREAVNEIKVCGHKDASRVVYITEKCNAIIRMINNAAEELSSKKREGSCNEQHYSDTSE